MVFIMTPYMRIRHKIEGIEGNRPLRAEEIRFGFHHKNANEIVFTYTRLILIKNKSLIDK